MNYSIIDIANICDGVFYGCNTCVRSVMADSRRSFGPDDAPLFVAVRGRNHNGHDFIPELYERGVRAFLIEQQLDTSKFPLAAFVLTDNSINALQKLAAHYRTSFKGTVVAITGSSCKTTVKELIARSLNDSVSVFRSPRSYNSQLGVPLSLLMMKGDEDVALIEAGVSRPAEMKRLAAMIRPDVGIFTGLGPEHDENFLSRKHKMLEKASLFDNARRIIYFGGDSLADSVLHDKFMPSQLVDAAEYAGMFAAGCNDEVCVRNSALAFAFQKAQGLADDSTATTIANMKPVAVKFSIRQGVANSIMITDMDNADVDSLPMALDYLNNVAGDRTTVLIMTDVPFNRMPDEELYGVVAQMVRKASVDRFIGVGRRISACRAAFGADSQVFDSNIEFFDSETELIKHLNQNSFADCAILLRGTSEPDFVRLIHQFDRLSHTTVLEVDLDAMRHNLDHYRSLVGSDVKFMAMIKASGYGNGDFEIADMLSRQNVDYLAVAFADEGVRLRERGISMPVVVLNADPDSFALMVANRLEPEIYSFRSLERFAETVALAGETAWPIHIKIDAGMHRLGFDQPSIEQLVALLRKNAGNVVVRSVFAHLAAADMPEEDDFTRHQIDYFSRAAEMLAAGLGYRPLMHILNTAGMERFPQARFDMCRLGIGLYGISSTGSSSELRSVSRLVTRIVQIRTLDPAETVGYGRAGRLERPSRLATIPVGYADGLDRRLGNGRWSMLVAGQPAPIVGRVCMDSCMIDVTGLKVDEGDEVVIFCGEPGHTVSDMADLLGTIPYEIMTSVSSRVKRIYLKE